MIPSEKISDKLKDIYGRQLIDVITTPIGSRLMNRSYGSTLHLFQDKPINEYYKAQIKVSILNAISTLSFFRVLDIQITQQESEFQASHLNANIKVIYLPNNEMLEINQLNIYGV